MNNRPIILGIAAALPLLSANVLAYDVGDLVARAGAATVDPREDSDLGLGLNSDTQLGLTGTYMAADHIGIGLLAATPFTHDISLGGTDIGEVKHLPPTLSVQYFFMDGSSPIQPYAGLGVNYTWTMDEKLTSDGKALGLTKLDIDNSLGLAAEVGVDYMIDEHLLVNAAVWYIDLEVDVSANGGAVQDDLAIDPFVYMIGMGYKF